MKVYFIGAGPGAPDLITLRGKMIVESADLIIYAGSLVNPEILAWSRPGVPTYDSAGMDLEAVLDLYRVNADAEGTIARLHTGDPSIYGAVQEQIDFCVGAGIPWEVVPGVSSATAAAASIGREFTLPEVSQTLIVTRIAGRTPVPEAEDLAILAASRASMAILLSIGRIEDVCRKLAVHYPTETPAAVVYRASWPDERIVRGTLADIAAKVRAEGITRQAIILVGKAVGAGPGEYARSKLYDSSFSHGFRKGSP